MATIIKIGTNDSLQEVIRKVNYNFDELTNIDLEGELIHVSDAEATILETTNSLVESVGELAISIENAKTTLRQEMASSTKTVTDRLNAVEKDVEDLKKRVENLEKK